MESQNIRAGRALPTFQLELEFLVQCLDPIVFIIIFVIHGIFFSNGILFKEAQCVKQTKAKVL